MPYREDYRKYLIEIFYVFETKFIYKQLIPKVRTNKKVEEKEKINFNYNKTEGLLYFKIPFEKKDEIKNQRKYYQILWRKNLMKRWCYEIKARRH